MYSVYYKKSDEAGKSSINNAHSRKKKEILAMKKGQQFSKISKCIVFRIRKINNLDITNKVTLKSNYNMIE